MYSFCEGTNATGKSKRHIRPLTGLGQKFGGGIDTASLCGGITPMNGGWDIRSEISSNSLKHCCSRCREIYTAFTAASSKA